MSKKPSKAMLAAAVVAVALGTAGITRGTIGYTGDATYKSVAAANVISLALEEGPDITLTIPRATAKRVLKVTATLRVDPYCVDLSCASDTDAWMRARVGGIDLFPVEFITVCKLGRGCNLTATWWEDVDTLVADGRATKGAPLAVTIHAEAGDFPAGIVADGQISAIAELVKKK